jgi:hypothetical protein
MVERLTTPHCKNPGCYEMFPRDQWLSFVNTAINIFGFHKRWGI